MHLLPYSENYVSSFVLIRFQQFKRYIKEYTYQPKKAIYLSTIVLISLIILYFSEISDPIQRNKIDNGNTTTIIIVAIVLLAVLTIFIVAIILIAKKSK